MLNISFALSLDSIGCSTFSVHTYILTPIARENAERKVQEKKAAEEKAAKRRAEKKAEEEKAAERRAEKKIAEEARTETGEYTVSATGMDIKAVTEKVIAATSGTSAPTGASFDIKA